MTDLNSLKINTDNEISDLKKARALLKSVILSNPKSASGWIAAARVEELDGKVQEARNIIANACQQFEDNEDIWLEAARLSPHDKTRAILAKAIQQMPKSKKLWLMAAQKEKDSDPKKGNSKKLEILRKALEHIPTDVELWKMTISLEEPEGAKLLLYKAV